MLHLSLIFQCLKVKYLTTHKVEMHAGAISKLLYVFVYVQAIIHSEAHGLSSRTDSQTIQYLCLYHSLNTFSVQMDVSLYHPYQLKHVMSHDVQGLHSCWWYKIVIPWVVHLYVR